MRLSLAWETFTSSSRAGVGVISRFRAGHGHVSMGFQTAQNPDTGLAEAPDLPGIRGLVKTSTCEMIEGKV
jgi:hypothetical protein